MPIADRLELQRLLREYVSVEIRVRYAQSDRHDAAAAIANWAVEYAERVAAERVPAGTSETAHAVMDSSRER